MVIVDIVTARTPNLYADLLEFFGQVDPSRAGETPGLIAAACRRQRIADSWLLRAWANPLEIGQPLPTLPLWLAENLAVPLDLERVTRRPAESSASPESTQGRVRKS